MRRCAQVIGWAQGDVLCLEHLPFVCFRAAPNWAELCFLLALLTAALAALRAWDATSLLPRLLSPPAPWRLLATFAQCVALVAAVELAFGVATFVHRVPRGLGPLRRLAVAALAVVPGALQDACRLGSKLRRLPLGQITQHFDWMDGTGDHVAAAQFRCGLPVWSWIDKAAFKRREAEGRGGVVLAPQPGRALPGRLPGAGVAGRRVGALALGAVVAGRGAGVHGPVLALGAARGQPQAAQAGLAQQVRLALCALQAMGGANCLQPRPPRTRLGRHPNLRAAQPGAAAAAPARPARVRGAGVPAHGHQPAVRHAAPPPASHHAQRGVQRGQGEPDGAPCEPARFLQV